MRDNLDRIGNNKIPTDDLPVVEQKANFDFSTPTEFVELPSKGKFYSKDHPLYQKETIEIKFMTAAEEDILTSKSLLKRGIVIDRFLQKIIIDKRIKIDTLLVGDKNAILVAARITGYGSDYKVSINCPKCDSKIEHEFDLSKCDIYCCEQEILEKFNITLTENNTLFITLPKTKWQVETKFLTGIDEKWLTMNEENKRKHKLNESSLTDLLKRIIISINNERNAVILSNVIENMPAIDSKYLRTVYTRLSPNINMNQNFSCIECGEESEVQIPIGINFFWQPI